MTILTFTSGANNEQVAARSAGLKVFPPRTIPSRLPCPIRNDGDNISRFCLLSASSDPFKYSWDDHPALFLIELFPPCSSVLELKPGVHHHFVSSVPVVYHLRFLPCGQI